MSFEFFGISTQSILDEPGLADATRVRIQAGGIGVVRQFINQNIEPRRFRMKSLKE